MTPTGTPVILLDYAVLLGLIIIVNIIIVQLFLALKTLNFKAFLYGLLVGLLQTIGLYMFLDTSVKLGLLFIIISISCGGIVNIRIENATAYKSVKDNKFKFLLLLYRYEVLQKVILKSTFPYPT